MTDLTKDWLDDWLLTLLPPEIMSVNIDSGGVHGTEVDINARKRAEAKQAITDKLREARINSLLDLEQWVKLHDLDKEMILEGIEHMVISLLQFPDQPHLDHSDRIAELKKGKI